MSVKFTKNAYDKLNENNEGVTFHRPVNQMTFEEIEEELYKLRTIKSRLNFAKDKLEDDLKPKEIYEFLITGELEKLKRRMK